MIVSTAARVTAYKSRFESSLSGASPRSKAEGALKNPRYERAASSFMEQAEVCREQARDAANLKRFHAALGLFATAATLYQHAITLESDASASLLIQDRLQQIEIEAASYYELARAMERTSNHF